MEDVMKKNLLSISQDGNNHGFAVVEVKESANRQFVGRYGKKGVKKDPRYVISFDVTLTLVPELACYGPLTGGKGEKEESITVTVAIPYSAYSVRKKDVIESLAAGLGSAAERLGYNKPEEWTLHWKEK